MTPSKSQLLSGVTGLRISKSVREEIHGASLPPVQLQSACLPLVREQARILDAPAVVVEMDAPQADPLAETALHLPWKCACRWVHYMNNPLCVLHPGNIHPGCFVHGKKEE